MIIYLVEPFFGGSHRKWAEGYQAYSFHTIKIFSMPARYWKWRMHGGAIHMADLVNQHPLPDLFLVTDMIDLTLFKACLLPKFNDIPFCSYFHENQISYPWSPNDADVALGRDLHYGFINFSSTLIADYNFFNSRYHLHTYFKDLENYLIGLPDFNVTNKIDLIKRKSAVLPLGIDFIKFNKLRSEKNTGATPVLLWNHRWEYDKNPELFFNTLFKLKNDHIQFRLIVLGEKNRKIPAIFKKARQILSAEIMHWGHVADLDEYARLLNASDILPVCSIQDFFGISIVEAMHCQVIPLLPDRLTYPDLIPESLRAICLYGENHFYQALKRLIEKWSQGCEWKIHLRAAVRQFDWRRMARIYDDKFLNLSHLRR